MNELLAPTVHLPITDVRIFPQNKGKLRAFAAVIFADCFKINGLKIIEGKSGLFVAMPNRKLPEGGFQDVAHPINSATRAYLERKVLRAYCDQTGEEGVLARKLEPRGPGRLDSFEETQPDSE